MGGLGCSADSDDFPCGVTLPETMSLGLAGGGLALGVAVWLAKQLKTYERGTPLMNSISDKIKEGAKAFLRTEYKYLTGFVTFFFSILFIIYTVYNAREDYTDGIRISCSFLAGAFLSAAAGWAGMMVATDANVRTTSAAQNKGLDAALRVAFTGGAVMGFTVVGLALVGLSIFYYIMTLDRDGNDAQKIALSSASISGFGFGASSIALFARVAGGIYTKAADVGADLVGKVEEDLPEDDPRNPAVIADNVGDNVGDVAGMGADLFESFVGSIIAAVTLAPFAAQDKLSDASAATLAAVPFWVAGAGVVASLIGFFMVKTKENATQKELMSALHKGVWTASLMILAFSALIIGVFFEGSAQGWKIYGCIVIGLFSGMFIGEMTERFTSYEYGPVRSITAAGVTGPATVIIQGLGIGMISCVPIIISLVMVIIACDALAGDYGIAIAACGMLSTLAIGLATDAYGPVADNAGGIAEMANLDEGVRSITDSLDALGNTTAATGKGFAIGSAVLTSLSLLSAFTESANVTAVNVSEPVVLAGVLFGAMLPLLFAALTMLSVQKAAGAIIVEVRRQFRDITGLREGREGVEPDTTRCVAISTQTSIEEMILPGSFAILAPVFIGFLVGPRMLTGVLGGGIATGAMLAILMSNAGGAWDNSKKMIEIEKAYGGKGTDIHKACVVGDTVGDPFKDTSGPALNILIKLMSMISLVIAPLIRNNADWESWYWGLIPLALAGVVSVLCYMAFWSKENPVQKEIRQKKEKEQAQVKAESKAAV